MRTRPRIDMSEFLQAHGRGCTCQACQGMNRLRCDGCGNVVTELRRCAGCKQAGYCRWDAWGSRLGCVVATSTTMRACGLSLTDAQPPALMQQGVPA